MVFNNDPENQNRKSCLEEKLKEKDKVYFSLYESLRAWANAQWKDHNDIFEQIRHGTSHSKKLHEFADILLEKQISLDVLDEREIFLILSALYLHDVGMQVGWKDFLTIEGFRNNLTWDERKMIRINHAKTTGHIIRSFKGAIPPSLEKRLSDLEKEILQIDLNEALAFICESHDEKDIRSMLYHAIPAKFSRTSLKIDFIAALLQLCDVLHMDKSRLNEYKFKDSLSKFLENKVDETKYKEEDWKRYFQCHYVEDVLVEPIETNNDKSIFNIKINCKFNIRETDEVQTTFKDIYEKRLKKTENDCVSVINKCAISFLNDYPIEILDPDSSKEKFPEQMKNIFDTKKADGGTGQVKVFTIKSSQGSDSTADEISPPKKSNTYLKTKIKKNIDDLIDGSRFELLNNTLKDQIRQNCKNTSKEERDWIKIFVEDFDVLDAILVLIQVSGKILEKMEQDGETQGHIKKTWEGLVSILGWIVLRSISLERVKEIKDDIKKNKAHNAHYKMQFPVKTEAGIEILIASVNESYAKLCVDKHGMNVSGPGKIDLGDISIENGWDVDDKVVAIKNLIWKVIHKKEKSKKKFSSDDNVDLNETLKTLKLGGENNYLAVDISQPENPLNDDHVYSNLINDLSDFDVIFISTDQNKDAIFICNEIELHARLRIFFRNKPE